MSKKANRCPCGEYSRQRDCPDCRVQIVPSAIEVDRKLAKAAGESSAAQTKYKQALKEIERLERSLGVAEALRGCTAPEVIRPRVSGGTNEATAMLVASDWHVEERVDPATINGVNEFNLEIAKARSQRFWTAGNRLIKMFKQDVAIPQIVVPLLGDFISGQIHGAENAENNLLLPTDAICYAKELLVSGLEYTLLQHPDSQIIVVGMGGNHSRTTQKTRLSGTENGHSWEYLMYLHMATELRHEPRITFAVPRGYHHYMDIYGTTVRMHHGHRLKYGGGRGGLFTPTYDAVDKWNKTKWADLDIFGHFHQMRDGGNFVCNGSLIGYNGFAESIKASYEPPMQTLLLFDKKRGRTCLWPVYLEGSK